MAETEEAGRIMAAKTTRRDLLKTGAAAGAAAALGAGSFLPRRAFSAAAAAGGGLFRHGVASGDPAQESVLLWTKLSPSDRDAGEGGGGAIPVAWRVSDNPDFSKIIAAGEAMAEAERDHIVKIEAAGLQASRVYFYQFRAKGRLSPIGRARTLPKAGARLAAARFAVVSCSNYNAGYFNAYRAIAARDDLSAVLHLGDYIYEYGTNVYGSHPQRGLTPPHETVALADYRARYALYRRDPDLQAMHQRHPVIAIWDDHEIANNSWHGGAQNHQAEEGPYEARQKAARQAFLEWLPIRAPHIYRSFDFGDLLRLIMLDTRHDERARPLSYGEFFRKAKKKEAPPIFDIKAFDKARQEAERRIFSETQEDFLKERLNHQKRWTVIGNQVAFRASRIPDLSGLELPDSFKPLLQMAALSKKLKRPDLPLGLDSWDGYPVMRQRILKRLASAPAPLILTGDTHIGWAAALKGVCSEFGAPSVSSSSFVESAPKSAKALSKRFVESDQSLFFADPLHRGYLLLEVSAEEARGTWFQTDIQTSGAPARAATRITLRHDAPDKGILKGILLESSSS